MGAADKSVGAEGAMFRNTVTDGYALSVYAQASWETACPNVQASLGNSIYGSSTTVQPNGLRVMPCIKS